MGSTEALPSTGSAADDSEGSADDDGSASLLGDSLGVGVGDGETVLGLGVDAALGVTGAGVAVTALGRPNDQTTPATTASSTTKTIPRRIQ